MEPPTEPSKEDCCNSGCNPCIFDVYEKQLKKYKQFLESGEVPLDKRVKNGISQLNYTNFKLLKIIQICNNHKFLLFKKTDDSNKVTWKPGDHFLLKCTTKDMNQHSCTRAYTPLKLISFIEDYDFAIIIKIYPNGLVSNYLNNLSEESVTKWRGPYGSYKMVPNQFKRIVMIAQGTGITAFISIIEKIISDEDEMTKIFLFYCTHSEETILLRNELYSYKQYWNFLYKVFLGTFSENAKYKYQEPIIHQKFSIDDLSPLKPFSLDDQILICGSEQFQNNYSKLLLNVCEKQNVIKF